jgi:hypothetical protein
MNRMNSRLRPLARSTFVVSCVLLIATGCASPAINPQPAPRIPGEIAGIVRDSASGQVVRGAQLRLEGIDTIPFPPPNDSGTFHLSGVPRGNYTLVVRRLGYRQSRIPLTVGAAPVRFVSVSMRVMDDCDIGCSPGDIVPAPPKTAGAPTTPISACMPPDSGGNDALDRYHREDTSTDASTVKWLANLSLPRIPVNQISLVGTENVCRQALIAFNGEFADQLGRSPMRAVYVIRYGADRFVVGNPRGPHAGEWRVEVVFDAAFRTITTVGR